jgi:hypothetical protein
LVDEPDPHPAAGAAPARVAELLRTFTPAPARRRRSVRPDAPQTIVPLLVLPDSGTTPLDPGRIDEARRRLKEQAATAAAVAPVTAPDVDPGAFDAARQRLRGRPPQPRP